MTKLYWQVFARQILLMLALLLPFDAAIAGYVNNYADWKSLNQIQKESYAMGIFDTYTIFYSQSDADTAHKTGTVTCFREKSIDSRLVSELISKGYDNPTTWGDPPAATFVKGVLGMCRQEINASRRAKGLPALKP